VTRAVRRVPGWIPVLLGVALAAHIAWQSSRPPPRQVAESLPPAPRAEALRLAAFGESAAAARLTMLYLQGFDARGVDAARLTAWLRTALALDPLSAYPLFAAARVFAETPDPAASRAMLEFVYQEFARDPDRRWPWLAHAALLAKHRLKDLPLARRYAAAIERHTTDPTIPDWARQMEIFILEEMNELEAARIMLGGLLATGRIRDPDERRFLQGRLLEIEERMKKESLTPSR
jgi:hypothetical protein